MRIKFIEQWKFKLQGRAVPVIKCDDVDEFGQIKTVHIAGDWKIRANSLVNTWDAKGEEICRDSKKITLINEKGISSSAFVVYGGKTINLYTQPQAFPNREDIIGKAATMDDIAEAMDLNKSMKNMVIGLLIGIGLGAFIIGPMLTTMLS